MKSLSNLLANPFSYQGYHVSSRTQGMYCFTLKSPTTTRGVCDGGGGFEAKCYFSNTTTEKCFCLSRREGVSHCLHEGETFQLSLNKVEKYGRTMRVCVCGDIRVHQFIKTT